MRKYLMIAQAPVPVNCRGTKRSDEWADPQSAGSNNGAGQRTFSMDHLTIKEA